MNFPTCTYDHALPLKWVRAMRTLGFDPIELGFVWAYPQNFLFGIPFPLTEKAKHKFLSHHAGVAETYLQTWSEIQ